MSARGTRREFLRQSAIATAGVIIAPAGAARTYAANEKVNVAAVGVGGMGAGNTKHLAGLGAAIVGISDVDRERLGKATQRYPKAKAWEDYRQMLEQQQKEIDAVMVSTPDHTHAPASMMAIKLGKHVSTEKPMTHSIHETRALAEAARKHKVVTQLDQEGHGSSRMRQLVEWIESDAIGEVREVHVATDRPIWPQGLAERPPTKPVPANLNWDLWIGPAPFREYHDGLHPFSWRGYWDFGCGALGDMGCHYFDLAFWALKLKDSKTIAVEAEFEGKTEETFPTWSVITYRFAARGKLPPVTLKWYDGGKLPPRPPELEPERKVLNDGSILIGSKGTLYVQGTSEGRIIPETRMKEYQPHQPEPYLPRTTAHKAEWLDAIKAGRPSAALSNFPDYGSPLTETVLLGNVAIRAGAAIEYDTAAGRVIRPASANQYLRREYRKGWEL